MCGRYALGIRAAYVRRQLEEHDMPVAEAPDDDDVRQTYNFAPGNQGLVYRADVPDYGAGNSQSKDQTEVNAPADGNSGLTAFKDRKEPRYKLQKMKWGLVPFWTKRNPDYGTLMRTINARDDSLASKGGMWNTMKQKKRCVVVAQGFYEWLKKNGGKEKIPHYMKRKDEQLMCFAGLWDCVQYEGSDEKLYTYTIITTDSNKQLSFLHDRMPVILENGSHAIRTWLDPDRSEWSKDLQSLLKPYQGELECYPVSKEVGKVGNNSPTFIVPVASAENKSNIANFFSNTKKAAKGEEIKKEVKKEGAEAIKKGSTIEHDQKEKRLTVDQSTTEDNAPLPISTTGSTKQGIKRELENEAEDTDNGPALKAVKMEPPGTPARSPEKIPKRETRSATINGSAKGSPVKSDGSQKITNFYK